MKFPAKESATVEFKRSFGDVVIETLVAFANHRGGSVYVGVSDDATIAGCSVGKESVAQWINEIKSKTYPHLIPDIEQERRGNKTVCVITIKEYPIKPVSFKGRYYQRRQCSNHLLGLPEILDLHMMAINTSWDFHSDATHDRNAITAVHRVSL